METVRVGIGHRILAAIVDALIVVVPAVVVSAILVRISPVLAQIVMSAMIIAYYGLEVLKARTIGKTCFGLRITKQDGSPATQYQLARRFAFKMAPQAISIVAALPFLHVLSAAAALAGIAVLVAALFMLKPEKLALYDQLFGTAVYGPAKVTFRLPKAADLKVTQADVAAAVANATAPAEPAAA